MRHIGFTIAVFFLIIGCKSSKLISEKKKNNPPNWVIQHPNSTLFYEGVGVSQKKGEVFDYESISKNNALADIANQIEVSVNVNSILTQFETLGKGKGNESNSFEESYKSFVKTQSKIKLKKVESYDSWQNESEYWVYFRLNKDDYKFQKEQEIALAQTKAFSLFEKGILFEKAYNINQAILFYIQALVEVKEYLNEPLNVQFEGKNIFLGSELLSRTNYLLQSLIIDVVPNKIRIQPGKSNDYTILLLSSIVLNNRKVNVGNIPIKKSFKKGFGETIGQDRTDENGSLALKITSLNFNDNIQVLQIEPDLTSFLSFKNEDIFLKKLFINKALTQSELIIEVNRPNVYVQSNEINFTDSSLTVLNDALIQAMGKKGLNVVKSMADADYIVRLNASTKTIGMNYDIHTSELNGKVMVENKNSGKLVGNFLLTQIKGAHLTFERAGSMAFQKAASIIELEIADKIVKNIFN